MPYMIIYRFFGFDPLNGKPYQRNPKRHILVRVRVVWAIVRENPSTRLTCRWVSEKRVIDKNWLYFTHSPISSPWTDVHQFWHSCRGRHIITCGKFWWSVDGCRFCCGSKIAISHWQSQSSWTQGWSCLAARDDFPLYILTCELSLKYFTHWRSV